MILDTCVLVDLLRGDATARAKIGDLEASGMALWVPSPAVFELAEGIERGDRPHQELERVESVLERCSLLDMTRRHGMRAGSLSGQLVRRGEMIDPVDALIAGMALEEGQPVMTRNARHFGRVPDLEVVPY